MRYKNLVVALLLLFSVAQGCKKAVVLNPIIENELIAFNEKVKGKIIKKYSVISLNFYEYNTDQKLGITLSNVYSGNEIQGLFYLDSIPVLLNFEDGSINKQQLSLIMENPDYDLLKSNLEDFIKSHEEKPQDSFDPPYILFNIVDGELEKAN